MANENSQASKKLDRFFRTAIAYYGKEIGLTYNQHFGIDQICDPEKEEEGEYRYAMQYGFPQSGCVSLRFGYSDKDHSFTIDDITVYAQPAGENMMVANFAPQTQIGPIGIQANFGIDMGCEKYTTLRAIDENPNALRMLDMATADLMEARILGECRVVVPEGSDRIPCCDCTYLPRQSEDEHEKGGSKK